MQTTTAAQAAEFVDYENRSTPESGGFDYKGPDETHQYVEENGEWFWVDEQGRTPVETKGFVGSPHAIANGLVCEHPDSPGWGPLTQVGQLIKGAGPHPNRAPHLNEHEMELKANFD